MAGSTMQTGLQFVRRGARRAIGRGRVGAAVASVLPAPRARPVGPNDVELVRAGAGDRDVLANLVQLYRHDMAELRGYELTEAGTYDYPHLDEYLNGNDREAWFVRAEGRLAGFVLARRLPDGVWQISEHFVARSWRGRGVGRVALAKAFALHEGGWTCFVDDDNGTSQRMCSGAVGDVGAADARTSRGVSRNGFVGTVYRFAVPGANAASDPAAAGCCAPAPLAADGEDDREEPGPVTCC